MLWQLLSQMECIRLEPHISIAEPHFDPTLIKIELNAGLALVLLALLKQLLVSAYMHVSSRIAFVRSAYFSSPFNRTVFV